MNFAAPSDFRFILYPSSFIPSVLAGMTRLELANQLIEGQPAFHFAFIPREIGERGEIRTHHKAELKSAASSNWATRARVLNGTGGGIRTHTV
jgi:hypothetical protein